MKVMTNLNDVGTVTEMPCADMNTDQLACKRFSIHGAYCMNQTGSIAVDPEYPTNVQFWEFDSVKKENDKCFQINGDPDAVLLTSEKTMVPYVLSKWLGQTDLASYENQTMRKQESEEKRHTSPYCDFKINKSDQDEEKRKHKLYTERPIEVQDVDKATVGVEFEPSGDDVVCCAALQGTVECLQGAVGAFTPFVLSKSDDGLLSTDILKLYTKTATDLYWK